jgi:hypothetical protein
LKSKVSAEAHLIEAFPGPTKGRSSAGPIGLPLPPPVAVCPPSPPEPVLPPRRQMPDSATAAAARR